MNLPTLIGVLSGIVTILTGVVAVIQWLAKSGAPSKGNSPSMVSKRNSPSMPRSRRVTLRIVGFFFVILTVFLVILTVFSPFHFLYPYQVLLLILLILICFIWSFFAKKGSRSPKGGHSSRRLLFAQVQRVILP